MRSSTLLVAALSSGAAAAGLDAPTSESGNPFVDGTYADPDAEFYNGEHWVFPTSSKGYYEQTYMDAFSSPDLVHWTKHPNILRSGDFSWANKAMWAPAPIERNGKYYLYFGANDIQSNSEEGGIGVGVADQPQGPYLDAIGKPLISKYYNGAQPIDQDVFIDDDGQAYIYYGGHSHANVAKLNDDMTSIGRFDDGQQFKEITPPNYVEGVQMFKRNGKYYLFWSEGGWTGPNYAVSYGMADSPLGPFPRTAKILEQDSAVATGSGHNGILNVPGSDIYYIVYHRHPIHSRDGNDRHLAYDRLYFNDDGSIKPIRMLVHDNWNDGNMIGWTSYGGDWDANSNALKASSSYGGKTLLNTDFADFVYEADITIPTTSDADAGLVFRVSDPSTGTDSYNGYYAGISTSGFVSLGKANGGWTLMTKEPAAIRAGETHHVKVICRGELIGVYVDDMDDPLIVKYDSDHDSGMNGLRVFRTEATFDNVKVSHLRDA